MDARTWNSSMFTRGALDPRQVLHEHEQGDADAAYLTCMRDASTRCRKQGKSWKTVLAYILGIALILYIAYFLYTYFSKRNAASKHSAMGGAGGGVAKPASVSRPANASTGPVGSVGSSILPPSAPETAAPPSSLIQTD